MKDVSKARWQKCAWGRWKTAYKAVFSCEPSEVILALRLTFLGRKLITFLMHLSCFRRGQLRDHCNPAGYLCTTKPLQKEAQVSLKEENPTGNVGAAISSNKHQAHQCAGSRWRRNFIPEQAIMAAASLGLSAATALHGTQPAKGSRPELPAGKQSWPLRCVGGSTKWHVHSNAPCWMPQPPEKWMLGIVAHCIKRQCLHLLKL